MPFGVSKIRINGLYGGYQIAYLLVVHSFLIMNALSGIIPYLATMLSY